MQQRYGSEPKKKGRKMRKEYYIAMKKLPSKYVENETTCADTGTAIVAANPKFAPIIFTDKEKKWRKIIFQNNQQVWAKNSRLHEATKKAKILNKLLFKKSKDK